MTMGRGAIQFISSKQKMNTRSSTEAVYRKRIDGNKDKITVEHTNDLPKYRCDYPDQSMSNQL